MYLHDIEASLFSYLISFVLCCLCIINCSILLNWISIFYHPCRLLFKFLSLIQWVKLPLYHLVAVLHYEFQFFYFLYLMLFSLAVIIPSCGDIQIDIILYFWTFMLWIEVIRKTILKKRVGGRNRIRKFIKFYQSSIHFDLLIR